jgi:hypothetical protein
MASKKKNAATTGTANLQTLRLGSRVRCTDDGVEGRIVWANAVAVKIEWSDGEKVTWKRESPTTCQRGRSGGRRRASKRFSWLFLFHFWVSKGQVSQRR